MLPVIYSDEFLDHETGSFHPEKPERLSAIATALKQAAFAQHIEWRLPTLPEKRSIISVLEQRIASKLVRTIYYLIQLKMNVIGQSM